MRLVLLACLVGCGSDPTDTPLDIELTQSAALLTHVGDQTVVRADGEVTWQSSNPDAVSVDAGGTITALVPVGSSQITATIGDTVSKPMLVVVAQPADGALLVDDAQVLDGPTPVAPDAPIALGYRVRVTLSETVAVAPGQIVLARESKPIAGRVTSVNGGDVELELVDLPQLFHKLSVDSSYHIDQAVFDESLAREAKPRFDFVEKKLGPFDCKISGSANAITGDASLKMEPDLVFAQRVRHDDQGEVSSITAILNGSITTTGTANLKFTPTVGLGASCKVNLTSIPLPFGGPLAVIAGFQVALGLRGEIAANLQSPALEAGFEIKQTSQVTVGFSYTPGTGLSPTIVPTTTIDGKLKFTMGHANNDQANVVIALGPTIGLEAGLHLPLLGVKKLSLIEAFVSLRAEGLFSFPLVQLADPSAASKYEAKTAVTVGPGSDARSALEFFGGFGSINPSVKLEIKLARSPTGKLRATRPDLEPGQSVELIVSLDDANLEFFGVRNIDEIRIYHSKAGMAEPELFATLPASSEVSVTWTPLGSDIDRHVFWAVVTTKLAPGIPLEVAEDSHIVIEVKPPSGPWRATLTWTEEAHHLSESPGFRFEQTMTASGTSQLVQSATNPSFLDEVSASGTIEGHDVSTSVPQGPFGPFQCVYSEVSTGTYTGSGLEPRDPDQPPAMLIVNDASGTFVLSFDYPTFSVPETSEISRTLISGPATCSPGATSSNDHPALKFLSQPLISGTFTPGASEITGTFTGVTNTEDGNVVTVNYTLTR